MNIRNKTFRFQDSFGITLGTALLFWVFVMTPLNMMDIYDSLVEKLFLYSAILLGYQAIASGFKRSCYFMELSTAIIFLAHVVFSILVLSLSYGDYFPIGGIYYVELFVFVFIAKFIILVANKNEIVKSYVCKQRGVVKDPGVNLSYIKLPYRGSMGRNFLVRRFDSFLRVMLPLFIGLGTAIGNTRALESNTVGYTFGIIWLVILTSFTNLLSSLVFSYFFRKDVLKFRVLLSRSDNSVSRADRSDN